MGSGVDLPFSSWLWGAGRPDSSRCREKGGRPFGGPASLVCPETSGDRVGRRKPRVPGVGPSHPSAIPSLPWASVLTFLHFKPCLLSKRGFIFSNYFLYRMDTIVTVTTEVKKVTGESLLLKNFFFPCGLVWTLFIYYISQGEK